MNVTRTATKTNKKSQCILLYEKYKDIKFQMWTNYCKYQVYYSRKVQEA